MTDVLTSEQLRPNMSHNRGKNTKPEILIRCRLTYGSNDNKLHGKRLQIAITTGGPADAYQAGGYNQLILSELLRPLQSMANLCGMDNWTIEVMMSLNKIIQAGYAAGISPEVQAITGKAPRRFVDFAQEYRSAWQ